MVGTDRKISLFDTAKRAKEIGESLDTKEKTETPLTFPNGCHIAEVEIDPDTLQIDPAAVEAAVSRSESVVRSRASTSAIATSATIEANAFAGNVAAFPNATVYIQRREVEKWSWAVSLPRSMDWLKQGVSTDDLAGLMHLAGQGQVAQPRIAGEQAHQLVEKGQPVTTEVLNNLYSGLLKEYYKNPQATAEVLTADGCDAVVIAPAVRSKSIWVIDMKPMVSTMSWTLAIMAPNANCHSNRNQR